MKNKTDQRSLFLTRKLEIIFLKTLPSKEQSRGKKKIFSESKISTKDFVKELEKRLSESTDIDEFTRTKLVSKLKSSYYENNQQFLRGRCPKDKKQSGFLRKFFC
jgi:hypothetical protein